MLILCSCGEISPSNKLVKEQRNESLGHYYYRIKLDNHWYIEKCGTGFIHDPDCPCGKEMNYD